MGTEWHNPRPIWWPSRLPTSTPLRDLISGFECSINVCLELFCFSERVNSSMSVQSLVRNPRLLPFGVISHTAVLNEPILSKADLETVMLYFCLLSPIGI